MTGGKLPGTFRKYSKLTERVMPNRRHQDITLTEVASAKGTSLAKVSRDARDGKLGIIQRLGRRALVDVDEAEAYVGRPITDNEIDAIRDHHSHRQPYPSSDAATLAAMDPGVAAFYANWRDTEWIDHLRKLGITVPLPPAFGPARPVLDLRNFFTRAQAEKLIVNALEQRDREWRDWANSGVVDQALYPYGPLPVSKKPL